MTPREPRDPPGGRPAPAPPPPVPLADPDGVAQTLLAAGKPRAAAEEVIRLHGARVRRYLRSALREPDEADDAYSLWAEWMVRAIDRFRGDSSLLTWSFGVARNAARRVRDDAFRRRRCSLRRGAISRVPDARASSSLRRVERAAAFLETVRRALSDEEREILSLRIDQGLAWDDVANVLASGGSAVSGVALRKRFERMKLRLQRLAVEMGELQ